jgi:hypothetical protein
MYSIIYWIFLTRYLFIFQRRGVEVYGIHEGGYGW